MVPRRPKCIKFIQLYEILCRVMYLCGDEPRLAGSVKFLNCIPIARRSACSVRAITSGDRPAKSISSALLVNPWTASTYCCRRGGSPFAASVSRKIPFFRCIVELDAVASPHQRVERLRWKVAHCKLTFLSAKMTEPTRASCLFDPSNFCTPQISNGSRSAHNHFIPNLLLYLGLGVVLP
jgi:hypothetical protein